MSHDRVNMRCRPQHAMSAKVALLYSNGPGMKPTCIVLGSLSCQAGGALKAWCTDPEQGLLHGLPTKFAGF
jgi:hypothetical protein